MPKGRTHLLRAWIPTMALFGAVSLAVGGAALAQPCQPPVQTTTTCVTAILLPSSAAPLLSFDISWANPDRAEYYLGDRSNAGIIVVDTASLRFKRIIGGFAGVVRTASGTVNTALSGPAGVVSHGRWLYAGDGDSTLKVIDLDAPTASAVKQVVSTAGQKRLDELAVSTDGTHLVGANNADDPAFVTLFAANGDNTKSKVKVLAKITIDPRILPTGFGLGIEQPAWEPVTQRFYASVPIIANNPTGCNFGQGTGPITCQGALAIIDPTQPSAVLGAFDASTNTGVLPVDECAPNGLTVGPTANLLAGCTPQNNPSNTKTLVINAVTKYQFVNIGNVTGSDEVFFNAGDDKYYLGTSRFIGGAALSVIDANTNLLLEAIPQGSGSHSVAVDSLRNLIFVPQVAPVATVGVGGDTTSVGQGLCGGNNGCIVVYSDPGNLDD